MITDNFIKIYEDSFKENWDLEALSDFKENSSFTYAEISKNIAKLHLLFEELGIKKGDKISIIGKNHSSWCIVFLATITYGAVIVPILNEFDSNSIEHIISHSDSKIVFINQDIWEKLNKNNIESIVINIPTFSTLKCNNTDKQTIISNIDNTFNSKYINGFTKNDIKYANVSNEDLACINYTSGTTGFTKGVMISGNNYAGNITYAQKLKLLFKGEKVVAFLPMAHTYGCAFDFLYGMSIGAHIYLLGALPTPTNIINAFSIVKPNIIITVPLVFEKIYKNNILPILNKKVVKLLTKIPIIKDIIYKKIKRTITEKLGGKFREIIIGGAPLNKETESFFYNNIKIPFTIGYGMTECAPLISYDHNYDFVPTSCGSILKGIMKARIDSTDEENIPGEIQVKGENVMMGYYKNPEATSEAFTEDGWFKTGDLGILKEGKLYIKGRLKTMILGSSGQNIYPEEIESRLNNLPYILESLVVERKNKLVAIVYPDYEAIKQNKIEELDIKKILDSHKSTINAQIGKYEQISTIEILDKEFEKTPKKTIKRFMYK